jgi:hypothetical protein
MAVQITGRQIANAAVGVAKLSLSTGSFDFSSGDATVSANSPTADAHVATKQYVDSIAQGLHWKDSARVATTGNITLSGTQTIDGIAVVAGDRILVKGQTDKTENGLYVADSGSWSRASDMDASSEFSGSAIFIQEGTANADSGYVCTNDGDVTIGTDNITFTQFTGAGQLSAGNGIDITNSTVSLDLDGATLTAGVSGLKVSDGGIDTAQIADSAINDDKLAGNIANGKLANSTISGVALGGTLGALSASASGAITMTSYDGSASIADIAVAVDGTSIEIASNALQIVAGGVTNAMLAGNILATKLALGNAFDAGTSNELVLADGVAGNGIDLTSEVLSIDLDGATLAVGANGLKVSDAGIGTSQIADSAVTAQKLAGSIPADKLNLGNGLLENGGNLEIDLDGSTLALGVNGLKVNQIGTSEIGADAITNAKIADDAVQTENLNFSAFFGAFDADGSTSTFELQAPLDLGFVEMFVVTVNGLVMEYKGTPDAQDNYKIDNGGTSGVARIVFGSNLANGDRVTIRGFINNP